MGGSGPDERRNAKRSSLITRRVDELREEMARRRLRARQRETFAPGVASDVRQRSETLLEDACHALERLAALIEESQAQRAVFVSLPITLYQLSAMTEVAVAEEVAGDPCDVVVDANRMEFGTPEPRDRVGEYRHARRVIDHLSSRRIRTDDRIARPDLVG